MPDTQKCLTGRRRLVRNVIWSLLGIGTPMLVAIVVIPQLIEALGAARFGVLTIAWMIVGYFSLFDLGLGRALTKLVAERIGSGETQEIPGVIWTAMLLMGILGALGAIVITLLTPWLVGGALEIPEELRLETLSVFHLLAITIPIVVCTTGLRGVLEAHQRFGLVTVIHLPLGLLTYLGPLIVLTFSNSLSDIVLFMVFVRIVSLLGYLAVCLKLFPELSRKCSFNRKMIKQLLFFGGWMTVSNITAPLLLYMGRFLIIVMISSEAVAYFVTPYEVVVSILIVPGVLVGVLFPEFTNLFQNETNKVVSLYYKSMLFNFLVMFPLVLCFYFFAKQGLAWWINEEFSLYGYRVLQILAIGVFINSFGHISQTLIQSYGRPDLTAKLHVAELIIYVPYLLFLINVFGINGAAIAWTIRVTISTLALSFIAHRSMRGMVKV